MKYDKQHFIAKFSDIPEDKWSVGHLDEGDGKHCVLGHCGASVRVSPTDEERALNGLFGQLGLIAPDVNDGLNKRYQQPNPKARILAALNDLP